MSNIEQIAAFLADNHIQIFSTSVDSIPHSRPIGSSMLNKGKIWYCMNKDKDMFVEMRANPMVCICVCSANYEWIRIYAKAVFSDDKEIKEAYIKRAIGSFKSVDDERFMVFYLEDIYAELFKRGVKTILRA